MSIKLSLVSAILLLIMNSGQSQQKVRSEHPSGNFSLGTRNTMSLFSDDSGPGLGIGGQFRLQLSRRINTEWFLDYITSKNGNYTTRNDYHIGWSVMFYPEKAPDFEKLITPYLLIGHCFDYSKVMSQRDPTNFADRTSMATQAGFGTHLNITSRLDCSISAQYMLHFGKEIHTEITSDEIHIEKHEYSAPHGHLLTTLSFNYKFADLW